MPSLIQSFVNSLLGKTSGELRGFKAVGNGVWVAGFTNNFQDSHREILSAKAHQRYVNRVKLGIVPLPELWHWHKQATKHGQADLVDLIGSPDGAMTVIAIGHFDDTVAGKAAEQHYLDHGPYELSHGFVYPAWALKSGVFQEYNTFEISTLPRGKAANPFTTFEEIAAMSTITKELKDSVTSMFGEAAPDIISQLEAIEQKGEKALELGTKFKDFAAADTDLTTQKDNAQPGLPADFVRVVLKAQGDQGTLLQTIGNAMVAWEKRSKDDHDAVATKLVELEALRGKLDAELKLAPQRIQDAVKALEDEDPEAVAAAKALADEADPATYDPMFPGMKIPVPAKK